MLAPDKTVAAVDALFLAVGLAYGLDAGSGVMDGLRDLGRGLEVGVATIPLVPVAILFDLLNGGNKDWIENPYRNLGKAALFAANDDFVLGTVGAGTGAPAATLKGGLGSTSLVLPNGVTVGALVAVNPVGTVTTPRDQHFLAAPFKINEEFGGAGPDLRAGMCAPLS